MAMKAEMVVKFLDGGSWVTLNMEQARELRDFLVSEPSVTVPRSEVAAAIKASKKAKK